ncbi:MAG: hypothetical protein Q4C47_08250, partial [Planctomycetia bacterium]|nr:hypothetical protein [Planctomycetia bacterium]
MKRVEHEDIGQESSDMAWKKSVNGYGIRSMIFCGISGIFCTIFCIPVSTATEPEDPAYREAIERDWERQEHHRDRVISDRESIDDALERGRNLYADLSEKAPDNETISRLGVRLESLAGEVESLAGDDFRATELYRKIRWTNREMALENPLVRGKRVIFLKRDRFACQMMHEYLGYYYELMNPDGGDLCVLDSPGHSPSFRSLIGDQLPPGVYQTLSLSYDGKTAFFAYVETPSDPDRPGIGWLQLGQHDFQKDTLRKLESDKGKFQIFSISTDGGDLKRITHGKHDNFDPVPLPDGGIAFLSTGRGGFVRCNNPWEPLPVYTLHRMNADGSGVTILSYHETNEWHPSVLNDGRIAYCRWDYMDRSAAHYHGIWTSRPDGTHPSILFGNYTQQISAFYQPRAIPGSRKILFVAGAHHADTGGSLAMIDPQKVRYDPHSGLDDLRAVERITPEVPFPETPDQKIQTYYHSPWPLSEDYYFTSYSHEPLGCFLAGSNDVGRTGLYYRDRFGNLELLYEDPRIACQYPIPLESRPVPPVIAAQSDEELSAESVGEFMLTDIRR